MPIPENNHYSCFADSFGGSQFRSHANFKAESYKLISKEVNIIHTSLHPHALLIFLTRVKIYNIKFTVTTIWIGIQLLCNIVLVSAVQCSELAVFIHISSPS